VKAPDFIYLELSNRAHCKRPPRRHAIGRIFRNVRNPLFPRFLEQKVTLQELFSTHVGSPKWNLKSLGSEVIEPLSPRAGARDCIGERHFGKIHLMPGNSFSAPSRSAFRRLDIHFQESNVASSHHIVQTCIGRSMTRALLKNFEFSLKMNTPSTPHRGIGVEREPSPTTRCPADRSDIRFFLSQDFSQLGLALE